MRLRDRLRREMGSLVRNARVVVDEMSSTFDVGLAVVRESLLVASAGKAKRCLAGGSSAKATAEKRLEGKHVQSHPIRPPHHMHHHHHHHPPFAYLIMLRVD